jgi:mono/diheme cytochrome c family protein
LHRNNERQIPYPNRRSEEAKTFPAFGEAYSDTEIAAVANYVTARFGAEPSKVTDKHVAEFRRQSAD